MNHRQIGSFLALGFLALPVWSQEPPRNTSGGLGPQPARNVEKTAGDIKPADSGPPAKRNEPDHGWEFTLSPYLWMSSVRADVQAGPVSTSTEACFTDLLKNLELGGSLRFEGMRDDRWGFFLDGTYLNLSDDGRARVGPFRIRGLGVDVDFVQAWLDAGGIYRFGEEGRAFDLMLGARYTYTSTDVSVGPLDRDNSEDFVTPVIAGRVEYALSPKWIASIKADAGGFGVDDGADLVWGVTGLLGYRLSDKAVVGFGYRYYDINFGGGRVDADVQYHGPMMGMSISF